MTNTALQQLFDSVRQAPPEVPLEQVVQWLDQVGPLPNPHPKKPTLFTLKNALLMTSLLSIAALLTRLILVSSSFFSPNTAVSEFLLALPGERMPLPKAPAPPQPPFHAPDVQPPKAPLPPETPVALVVTPRITDAPLAFLPPKAHAKMLIPMHVPNVPIQPVPMPMQRDSKAAEVWVDTVFSNIHTIDLDCDYCSDIIIARQAGQDVRLRMQASARKGKKGSPQSIYEMYNFNVKQDKGVLKAAMRLKPEVQVFGLKVSKGTQVQESKMYLYVPDSISLSLKSSFGNIAITGLNNKLLETNLSYGNVRMESSSAERLNIKTSFGNVDLQEVTGHVAVKSSYGNIRASGLTLLDDVDLRCSFGNIVLQLTNPIDEMELDLLSSFGKIHVKPLGIKTSDKLVRERGGVGIKLVAKTSYGDIRIE